MSDLQGEWKGFANIQTDGFGTLPTRSYRFILVLRETAEGDLSGHADGPDIGVMQMPLEGLKLDGDELSCGISAMGARFRARLRADRSALDSVLAFGGGGEVPLVLERDAPEFAKFDIPRLARSGRPQRSYEYVQPEETGDGWETAGLADAGISSAGIRELMTTTLAGDFARHESVLLARGGRLVLEEYFYGQQREATHTFQSVTKSITSMVVGLAVDRDLVDLEAPVYEFFRDYPDAKWIREKYPVTVRHALMMTGGLAWNEALPYTDPGNNNRAMNGSGDYIGYILDRDLAVAPGTVCEYCSGLSILLGGIVKSATGLYVDELAARHMFPPLGISLFGWGASADGTRHTGGGLHLRPRDMAKLGQLMLDRGTWKGERVLSESWVRESTARHHETEVPYASVCEFGYGYQWWLPSYRIGDRRIDVVAGRGYGGQCVGIVPELDLVVVLNADDYEGDRTRLDRMIGDFILPAVAV